MAGRYSMRTPSIGPRARVWKQTQASYACLHAHNCTSIQPETGPPPLRTSSSGVHIAKAGGNFPGGRRPLVRCLAGASGTQKGRSLLASRFGVPGHQKEDNGLLTCCLRFWAIILRPFGVRMLWIGSLTTAGFGIFPVFSKRAALGRVLHTYATMMVSLNWRFMLKKLALTCFLVEASEPQQLRCKASPGSSRHHHGAPNPILLTLGRTVGTICILGELAQGAAFDKQLADSVDHVS